MCALTLEKNHSLVHFAPTLVVQRRIWKSIFELILGKNHTFVHTALIGLHEQTHWNLISSFIRVNTVSFLVMTIRAKSPYSSWSSLILVYRGWQKAAPYDELVLLYPLHFKKTLRVSCILLLLVLSLRHHVKQQNTHSNISLYCILESIFVHMYNSTFFYTVKIVRKQLNLKRWTTSILITFQLLYNMLTLASVWVINIGSLFSRLLLQN